MCASDDKSTAFKTDASFIINGGTIMGIAKKKSTVATSSKQGSKYYTGVKVTGGSTISYNGVSYTVPAFYNNASANIMVSKAGM